MVTPTKISSLISSLGEAVNETKPEATAIKSKVNAIAEHLSHSGDLSSKDTYDLQQALRKVKASKLTKKDKELKGTLNSLSKKITQITSSHVLKGVKKSPSPLNIYARLMDPSYTTRHASSKKRQATFNAMMRKKAAMETLGGAEVTATATLKTEGKEGGNIKVDSMHLTVRDFITKVQEGGGALVTLTDGEFSPIDAIQLPKDGANTAKLLKAMEDIGIIGNGWSAVEKEGHLFVVAERHVKIVEGLTDYIMESKDMAEEKDRQRPVAIVSQEIHGHYEFASKQAGPLLMMGMDARFYNYAGQGESEGLEVTDEGRYASLKAQYDDVKRSGYDPSKIVFISSCIGAAPTSQLAAEICSGTRANTPEDGVKEDSVNMILIKSPANYLAVAKMKTMGLLDRVLDRFAEQLHIPRVDVANNLEKVRGHKFIIAPQSDEYSTGTKHLDRNMKALQGRHITGKHALWKMQPKGGHHSYFWHRHQPTRVEMKNWVDGILRRQGEKPLSSIA